MYRGIVLRHHRTQRCDRSLRGGFIFSRLCNNVFKLPGRGLSGYSWYYSMYGMYRGIVLCHHRTQRSDWSLHRWYIFGCFCDCLFKLSCWDLSSHDWFHSMHGMRRWILLCYHRPDCSDSRLLNWEILGNFSFRVFKLSLWFLSGHDWINIMRGMHRRLVLCHRRLKCSDRSLRRW